MSEHPPIHQVLAAVMAEVRAVGKGEWHKSQAATFRFRGIDAVVNAVAPVLRKHEVVVFPSKSTASYRDVTTSQNKRAREVTVRVVYTFLGPAGDHLDVEVPGESMDMGDKGTAKAMSVAYRIALLQALCLPTDEPDPDHDAYERGSDSSEADDLRAQILAVAKEKDIPATDIASDFEQRAKINIRDAEPNYLRHYLGHLRTHGLVKKESADA
jgi:hypothetical protein